MRSRDLLPFRMARSWSKRLLANRGLLAFRARGESLDVLKRIADVRSRVAIALTDYEAFHLYCAARAVVKVPGDMAEIGVFQGGSASLLCEAKGDKTLRLFDTFEGIPAADMKDIDREFYYAGQYAAGLEFVKKNLSRYQHVSFHQGIFPESAADLGDLRFSLVHMDVDTEDGTRACLEWFYPRMSPGGFMISHDYPVGHGVKKAVDEFFAQRPEGVMQLFGNQCLIVKQ